MKTHEQKIIEIKNYFLIHKCLKVGILKNLYNDWIAIITSEGTCEYHLSWPEEFYQEQPLHFYLNLGKCTNLSWEALTKENIDFSRYETLWVFVDSSTIIKDYISQWDLSSCTNLSLMGLDILDPDIDVLQDILSLHLPKISSINIPPNIVNANKLKKQFPTLKYINLEEY